MTPSDQAVCAAVKAASSPLARAHMLNKAMLDLAMERDGLRKISRSDINLLLEASLVEMAQARVVIKQDEDDRGFGTPDGVSRSVSMVCDDRLVAAIYAFMQFAVPPAHRIGEDDYLLVKLDFKHWGEEHTAFLACGNRPKKSEDNDEDEDEDR